MKIKLLILLSTSIFASVPAIAEPKLVQLEENETTGAKFKIDENSISTLENGLINVDTVGTTKTSSSIGSRSMTQKVSIDCNKDLIFYSTMILYENEDGEGKRIGSLEPISHQTMIIFPNSYPEKIKNYVCPKRTRNPHS